MGCQRQVMDRTGFVARVGVHRPDARRRHSRHRNSLTDDRYFATRAIVLDDRRTVVTVEFVADTYDEMLQHVERLAKNTAVKFAISPSIDIHWPLALERRKSGCRLRRNFKVYATHKVDDPRKVVVAHRRANVG
jgi:hypothetical protein